VEARPRDASASLRPEPLLLNLAQDQKNLWLSPLRLRLRDVTWLAPLVGLAAGVAISDAQFSRHLNNSPSRLSRSRNVSNAGVAGLVGVGGGLYLWGLARHDDQKRETGILSGEAAVDSYAASMLLKLTFGRERPLEGDGQGSFLQGGQSFPSEHAAVAWSIASVIAHEYPGPLTQLFVYGAASAVSVARITSKQHFPTDVLVGSALGWFVGQQVFRAHHDADLGLPNYGQFVRDDERSREAADMGSPYVPSDSWVYAAFDRLSAKGYVQSAFMGLRPWTRLECARLVQESEDLVGGDELEAPEEHRLQVSLVAEFHNELERLGGGRNFGASLDSVYTRWTGISGTPLRDGYHFGQTLINDYGRPYGEGNNLVTGFTSRAVAGPLAFYVRGEYQHAPGIPEYPAAVQNAIAAADFSPVANATPRPADDFTLLESYLAIAAKGFQVSFGKQSLWWAPDQGGSFVFSNNAEPIWMLRLNRTTPLELPGIFSKLGPMRTEFFIGRLSGQHRINTEKGVEVSTFRSLEPQPFVHGQKISFKPTPNFEFSVSRTTVFGGPNFPFTTHRFLVSMFSGGNAFGGSDPGDRRSAVDFSYRVPKLRKWLVFYNDAYTEDEISPIAYPRRAAMNPGLYMPQIPGIPKLDFRAEGVYTDLPAGLLFSGFNYFNVRYLDGYTNRGQLMGNWVGRQGHGMQFWSTYWAGPQNKIQIGYRKQSVDPDFLKGGDLQDVSARADWKLRRDLDLSASVQYERWNFPLLSSTRQSNVATSIQLTYRPKWGFHMAP
jgi:membrane-associated phospholipid phosphatase